MADEDIDQDEMAAAMEAEAAGEENRRRWLLNGKLKQLETARKIKMR